MIEHHIEDKLRLLGQEWPIPTVREFVSEKVVITPQLRSSVPKRRWAMILVTGGLATAATILIVIAAQLSTPVTLYAAVQRTLRKAGRAHVLIESFDKGARQFTEIWFDKALGVRTEHGNTIVVDDGKSNWMWNTDDAHSDGVVLRRPSSDALTIVGSMLDLSRAPPDWRKNRSPAYDQEVGEFPCKAYLIEEPSPTESTKGPSSPEGIERRAILLIDGDEQPRQVINQRRLDGKWSADRRITIDFDAKVDSDRFIASFPRSSRVIDVDQGLDELYPLHRALAQREVEGLLFAVHRVIPLKGGLYYIVSSARGTPEFLKKYPPLRRRLGFNYTALDVASHNVPTGTSSNHYTMRLFHVEWYGVEYSWWILAPYKGSRDALVTNGKLSIPLVANCYHPDLRDARGVLRRVATQLEVDVPATFVEWIDAVRALRRDAGVVKTLWGEGESPLVFGSMDNNTLHPIRIDDISDTAYAEDLHKLYRQLQGLSRQPRGLETDEPKILPPQTEESKP